LWRPVASFGPWAIEIDWDFCWVSMNFIHPEKYSAKIGSYVWLTVFQWAYSCILRELGCEFDNRLLQFGVCGHFFIVFSHLDDFTFRGSRVWSCAFAYL
jgi:hypothetical protein